MIIVSGEIKITPTAREATLAAAREMALATQAEDGCISYMFYASVADENIIRVFEEWQSDEALQRHFETPHMAKFMAKLPELVAGPADVKRYEVNNVTSLS
jgi:quinol monooxygenase YgiN